MSTSIRLKKSSVSSNAPTTGDIDYGELAINYADGKLYYKTSSNTIDYFGSVGAGGGSSLWTQNGSDIYYNTGNVGIGVTSPGEALEVDGNIEITGEFIGDLRGPVTFKAQASENLTLGDAVYISGVSGQTPTVAKADADDATKMPCFGLVEATTTSGNPCTVITFGSFIGYDTVNTSDSPTWTLGDTLYVSTVAGEITNVPPAGESALIQNIGKVQRIDASAGRIKVGGAGRSNATPNLNEGRLFVGNASNRAVADDTVHIDIANTRVGINDTTPSYTLDVNGTFRTTGNSIIGDGVGDTLTINAGTIDVPSISAGTDNTVLVYNGTSIVTDEIDPRVWGSTLVDGSGTANTITKWSDSNTVTDSLITDDGTTVSITTNTTSDALLITSTEDSSDAAPVITLKRNSSTPADGDYLGQIKFKGENDADQEIVYGKITGKISDASDGTEDGLIEYALKGGGSNVIAARLTSTDLKLINGVGLEVAGNSTLGDASDDSVTINGATIALANVAAGTDNTVLVYNGSSIVTDEIDSRVWGSTLVDGSGTATYVTKWSDSNTVTDSVITDDGTTVTIGGNLTVNGTTTTLNTSNSVVTDNLFELNSGVTSNANDSGIIIERGSTGDNALFIWDESADKFALGTTTATADSTGNITYTDAGLIAGTLDISGDAAFDTDTLFVDVSTDRVGIGTATPSHTLDVSGEFRVNGGGTGSIVVNDEDSSLCPTMKFLRNGGGTTTNDFIKFENSGGEVAAINATGGGYFIGNLGIGTLPSGTNTLDINGSLKINGEVIEKTVNTTGVTGTTALDPANGTVQRLVFSGDVTFTDSLADGESITLHIDDGPDSPTNTATWPTITWATGSAPTLNTSTDTIVAVWKVNSTLYGATVGTSQDVVSDTTPQLGGNLDVNGKDIVSVSNGDIELAPDGTGVVVFKGDATKGSGQFKLNCEQNSHAITIKGPPHSAAASYTLVLPNDDGTSNQVLTTDGSGNLSWSTPSGSYGDSDVDTHLNQSSAGSGEVLSWNGSDYAWVANSGSSGGTSGTSDRIISIDAGALVPRTTNGAASATEEYATNDVMSDHFLFDGATEEGVQFRFNMPPDWDGNAVNAKFYWDAATGASAADGVTWGIAMQAFQNDDALDNAFGTSVDTDDAVIAVGDLHVTAESADITIAGSPSAGDLIFAEVTRVVGDANDTMTEDAKLIGVTIHYTASVSSQVSINAQTGTTYTTVLTDASKLVTLNNASAITLTIPPNSSVAYPIGTKIDLLQIGAGQVTVAAGAGVTVNSTPTLKLRAQYSGATCIQYAADTWILAGDLAAS